MDNQGNSQKSDYDKYEFLKRKNFVISNLDNSLSPKRSKYEDRVFSIVMAGVVITIFLIVVTLGAVMRLTGLNAFLVIFIYCVIAAFIILKIISAVQFNMKERIRQRTISGKGNQTFSLGDVWGITPGGIKDVDINEGKTLGVKYTTNAIILRGIMKGTVDCPSDMDRQHYAVLQKMIDIAMQNKFDVEIVNLKYDIDNDPIWGNEAQKIHDASSLGPEYVNLRTTLFTQVYDYTKVNSKVAVQYYILKSTPRTLVSTDGLAVQIQKLESSCQLGIMGISTHEFKNFLEEYYGVIVSIEDILNFVTITTTSLGECKVISYRIPNKGIVQVGEMFDYSMKLPRVSEISLGFNTEEMKQNNKLKGELFKADTEEVSIATKDVDDLNTSEYIIGTSIFDRDFL